MWITPQPVRDSVTNFFSNIGDVYIAANNLLQLKITDGVEDIMRIVINTVFGVGGLFDVATLAKLPKHDNDLGLTLGHYGVPPGPYLVLPLFGPSTVRDAVGSIGNYYVNPLSYIDPRGLSWALYGLNIVNTRANLLNASDVLEGAALDKYSFVRNAYLQRRQYLLSDGRRSRRCRTTVTKRRCRSTTTSTAARLPRRPARRRRPRRAAKTAAASGRPARRRRRRRARSGIRQPETPPLDLNGGPETTQIPAGNWFRPRVSTFRPSNCVDRAAVTDRYDSRSLRMDCRRTRVLRSAQTLALFLRQGSK